LENIDIPPGQDYVGEEGEELTQILHDIEQELTARKNELV